MKTTLIRNIAVLISALAFLCLIYLFSVSLSARQSLLEARSSQLAGLLSHQESVLLKIQKALGGIRPPVVPHEHLTSEKIHQILESSAQKCGVRQLHYTALASQMVQAGKKYHIKKTPFHLTFFVKTDDDLWRFLKDLAKVFPGIITSQVLSLEKAQDQAGLILKGSYHFEWYSLHSSSSGDS